MKQLSLSGAWRMRQVGCGTWHDAVVPGSVYADLLRDGTLPSQLLGGWNSRPENNRVEALFTFSYIADYCILAKNLISKQ